MAKAKKAHKKRTVNKARRPKRKAVKRKPAKRKVRRRKVAAKSAAPRRRKRKSGKRVIKQVERRSVERVMAGKRTRRRRPRKRAVRMAGSPRRRRSVGGMDGHGMLVGLAIGAAALYFLTKGSTGSTQTGNYNTLPPLTSTTNYTRNQQSQDIVNYAIAAGLTIDAITNLIQSLNTKSDQEVQNTYDVLQTSGTSGLDFIA